ncbi:MAG TPA: V-type ATP synthase subunit F [Candidatus Hydrogenedentes bacterium]|jgi:V/A-type H+-transporting ATPase subunit F|nr:V-type ATP synthase subunit F [Candidatus Hydrogenedentota bacterium]HPJ98889.1 V-type ATP synthase subunit F [Candidatus Hydrogenedentota bacterium]
MSKAVVVGEESLVLGFKGAGFEIVDVPDGEQLLTELNRLARDPAVALVLVTESVAEQAPGALQQFREVSQAILTTIPTHLGSKHLGFKDMRRLVERSIGVDLLG